MKQNKCQILFIQETHFAKEQINKINQNCDSDYYQSMVEWLKQYDSDLH
jgi:hypothetical protein